MDVSVKDIRIKIGVLLGFLVMVTVNALANILPINGINTGEVSARFDTLFTPAATAFAIWGAIYLMLAVYVLFQWLPSKTHGGEERQMLLRKVGSWFILNSLVNAGWIFAWHYGQFALSLVLMLLILFSLGRIGWLLRVPHCSPKEELALRVPFGLYFGWITVATVANVSVLLVSVGWDGFGISPIYWTAAVLLIGLAIAGVTMYAVRSVAYGLSVAWAFAWILYRHLSSSGYGGQYPQIIAAAALSLGVLLTMLVVTGVHMRRVAACKAPQ
jgi:hypothetical protein